MIGGSLIMIWRKARHRFSSMLMIVILITVFQITRSDELWRVAMDSVYSLGLLTIILSAIKRQENMANIMGSYR